MCRTLLIHHLQHKSFVTTDEQLKNFPTFCSKAYQFVVAVLITETCTIWMQMFKTKYTKPAICSLEFVTFWSGNMFRAEENYAYSCLRVSV